MGSRSRLGTSTYGRRLVLSDDAVPLINVVQGDALSLPLPDESVDLVITSPPYFSLRSYQDAGEHYEGQVGCEETPHAFLESLWAAAAEMKRVLKPSGSIFVNLGDKYAGSGGHNNNGLAGSTLGYHKGGGGPHTEKLQKVEATRRNAPNAYNKNTGGIPDRSLMLLPERFRIGCVDRLGLIARAVIIWAKPNGMPESVTNRVRRAHEDWVHLVKDPKYFASIDEIREPSSGYHRSADIAIPTIPGQRKRAMLHTSNPAGKLPPSVWSIATEPLRVPEWAQKKYDLPDHFAAFPTEWPRRLILGWSPVGGTVLDPFGGTGTTALVARALGRNAVSVDLSHDYCELARWRINESGHGSKALGRTWKERQEGLAV